MYLILYNPLSKNNKSNISTHKLIKHFKEENIPFRIKSILKIDDLENYLLGKEHFTKIILLGGDGTINRFINDTFNYTLSQDICLRKNGSGNDFLRSLMIDDSRPQTIMQARFNNGRETKFINGSGVGIDGMVIHFIETAKRKGKFRYFKNTVKALFKYKPVDVKVIIDEKEYEFKKTYLITMNNGKYFGGGMKISPDAKLDDEFLDILIAHNISKLKILLIFLSIYFGKHTAFKKHVFHTKAKNIKVVFETPQLSQCDGELTYDVTEMTVEPCSKKIHLKYHK